LLYFEFQNKYELYRIRLERTRRRIGQIRGIYMFQNNLIPLYMFISPLKKNHKDYVKKLEEVDALKKNYLGLFQKYKKKLNQLDESIKK
jgi:hypothetical protein